MTVAAIASTFIADKGPSYILEESWIAGWQVLGLWLCMGSGIGQEWLQVFQINNNTYPCWLIFRVNPFCVKIQNIYQRSTLNSVRSNGSFNWMLWHSQHWNHLFLCLEIVSLWISGAVEFYHGLEPEQRFFPPCNLWCHSHGQLGGGGKINKKLQNMGEIVAVTAPGTILWSGIDSAAESEARFDTKSSERVCKVSLDGAARGWTLIQHNRCRSSFISSFEGECCSFSKALIGRS